MNGPTWKAKIRVLVVTTMRRRTIKTTVRWGEGGFEPDDLYDLVGAPFILERLEMDFIPDPHVAHVRVR